MKKLCQLRFPEKRRDFTASFIMADINPSEPRNRSVPYTSDDENVLMTTIVYNDGQSPSEQIVVFLPVSEVLKHVNVGCEAPIVLPWDKWSPDSALVSFSGSPRRALCDYHVNGSSAILLWEPWRPYQEPPAHSAAVSLYDFGPIAKTKLAAGPHLAGLEQRSRCSLASKNGVTNVPTRWRECNVRLEHDKVKRIWLGFDSIVLFYEVCVSDTFHLKKLTNITRIAWIQLWRSPHPVVLTDVDVMQSQVRNSVRSWHVYRRVLTAVSCGLREFAKSIIGSMKFPPVDHTTSQCSSYGIAPSYRIRCIHEWYRIYSISVKCSSGLARNSNT